ncbi:MAG: gamma-glutamyltransferase, partial [Acidimicrobiia bacterium]|nr:gamma-glutamyltransferase [Acidimicrobiia bacterium]
MNRHTFGDIVVTSHELATQSGLEILAKGGNAVDAAIAANATLGVVAPETCGIGGDLFALVHRPGDVRPITLNASGPAGSNVRSDHLTGPTIPITDPASVTIPGCVRGWEWLSSDLGSLSLDQVLRPAIDLARNGFPASAEMSASLTARSEQLAPQPSAQGLYVDGQPPQPGTMIKRSQLEQTLGRIASDGAAGFYEGSVAGDMSEAVGGFITLEDLAAYRPEWVQPISLDVFGHTGWTVPPNSQGYLTLATARIFELSDPPADPEDPAHVHLMIEAYRAVAARRDDLLSDPRTAADHEELLGEELLSYLAGQLDRRRAGIWPSPNPVIGGTTYLSVVDRAGIGVSLIQSNFHGIGSGIGAGTSGFFLHNRGAGFTLTKGHRNELSPGKRP